MVDYTVFYVIGIIGGLVGLTLLVRYLKAKNYIDKDDISIIMGIFGLSMEVVNQLNLKKEQELFNIMNIVYVVLVHFSDVVDANPEIVKEEIKLTVRKLVAERYGLNSDRERIIDSIIELSFQIGIKKAIEDIDKKYITKVISS